MARKSTHAFPSDDDLAASLLSNYQPIGGQGYFYQVYMFPMKQPQDASAR